jgi:glycosyltransferase involved in cell wall biosynthesis
MPIIAIDAREARAARPRGRGRYARELIAALRRLGVHDLREEVGGIGPEVLREQVGWPGRLARQSADLVHAAGGVLPLRRPCPGLVSVHDLAFEAHPTDLAPRAAWRHRTFVPRSVRSAELTLCGSAFTAADVATRYGVDPGRLRVVPYAPALARGAAPLPGGAPYLLAVGDGRPSRNLDRLVAAFAALRAGELPDHRLVLAGAATPGRPPAGAGVEVTGWLDDERLDALMRGADVLVHPSLYDGAGLVVLEAMARGVPVAAAEAAALPAMCTDAAELFDPFDPAAIAAAVLRARARRTELVAAGRARAELFTWDATAEATALVYRELL